MLKNSVKEIFNPSQSILIVIIPVFLLDSLNIFFTVDLGMPALWARAYLDIFLSSHNSVRRFFIASCVFNRSHPKPIKSLIFIIAKNKIIRGLLKVLICDIIKFAGHSKDQEFRKPAALNRG